MRKLLIVFPILFLAACGNQQRVVTAPVIHERAPFTTPTLVPARQLPFEWSVITRENAQNKLRELEARSGSATVFALSPQGYQNLSLNIAELRRYIEQQNSVIAAMREYYEEPTRNAAASNNGDINGAAD